MMYLGPGDTHPVVGVVARKLGLGTTSDYFSNELAARVRGAQMRLGQDPSGIIDDDLLDALLLTRSGSAKGR